MQTKTSSAKATPNKLAAHMLKSWRCAMLLPKAIQLQAALLSLRWNPALTMAALGRVVML